MSFTGKNNQKSTTGECEFCGRTNVALFPQHNDMMCSECIAREDAVVTTTKVVEDSREKDSRIQLKSDVMQAATTSFIELQGAINNNPTIVEADRKYALALEAAERIKKLDAAIFAHEEIGVAMKNERMAWIKNTQQLVATLTTLRADQRAQFAHINVNYKPATPAVSKIKKVAKAGTPKFTSTGARKYTPNQIKEACEKFGADRIMVSNMLLSPRNRDLTLEQVVAKYLEKSRD